MPGRLFLHEFNKQNRNQAADFLFGTFAPFLRASDRPIAMACFLLVTFPPVPDRSEPRFRRRIALSTVFAAARPYFLPPDLELFFGAICILPSVWIFVTPRAAELSGCFWSLSLQFLDPPPHSPGD